jgi:S1-C subfamily serine protease
MSKENSRNIGFILAIFLFSVSLAFSQQIKTVTQIVDQYGKSIVLIVSQKIGSNAVSLGSGFIVRSNGIIVTNYHVVRDAYPASVKLGNGDIYEDISIIEIDEKRDIAIIKIKAINLPTVSLGNSDFNKVGEKIVVIGNPEGLENTVSDGLISGVRDTGKGYKWNQISAPISGGSSGSPVFNLKGEVIGIAVASMIDGQNLNFCIPINYAVPLISEKIKMTLAEYVQTIPESIMEKIIQARGGREALKSIADMISYVSFEVKKANSKVDFVVYNKEPNKKRTEFKIDNKVYATCVDGKRAWSNAKTGYFEEEFGDTLKKSLRDAVGFDRLFNPKKYGIMSSFAGKEKIEGIEYYVIEAKDENEKYYYYYDTNTYFLYKTKYYTNDLKGEKTLTEEYYGDYRNVNGVYFSFKNIAYQHGEEFTRKNYDRIIINSGLDDSLFTILK